MFSGVLSRETEAMVAQQMNACHVPHAEPVHSLVEEMTVNSANYSGWCCVLEGGLRWVLMIPQGSWGFSGKLKEEVIFQMSLKEEKVFQVERDVIGSPGMA